MNSAKAQQSFSSYSQQDCNDPQPSEEDKFSEYQEQSLHKVQKSDHLKQPDIRPAQKRRYSYGKLEEKPSTFNYLNPLGQTNSIKPTFFTSNLQNLKQCKYIRGVGSPCGIGAFESSALEEYEKCYLSGLSKYYKSHNYINKKQAKALSSVSSSVEKDKNLDRSEYWNGQKFSYLMEKEKLSQQLKERKRSESSQNYERNMNSGLIVNKKDIKQGKSAKENKVNETLKGHKKDSNEYIRIQQDFSNSKNCSEVKRSIKHQNPISVQNISQTFQKQSIKPNAQLNQKNQQNDTYFQSIRLTSQSMTSTNSSKDFTALLAQKNNLAQQNASLRQTIIQKNSEIEKLSLQRIKDNDDYTQKIQKLKTLFESERKSLIKQHEEEVGIYKQVRKEAIKNELVKEEEERLNLIIQKNRIQNELKRVIQQLSCTKQELTTKNSQLTNLEKKLFDVEKKFHSQNQNLINDMKKVGQKEADISLKKQTRKEGQQVQKEQKERQIPEWMSNFLSVFKNMVRKLVGQTDEKWSDKKMVIIGWKMVKIMIEKGVKLGIKVPEVVNQNEMGDCSLIYDSKNSNQVKKYNMTGSKKPIRS